MALLSPARVHSQASLSHERESTTRIHTEAAMSDRGKLNAAIAEIDRAFPA